ncbi:hypothetical protein K466DRAFT_605101 [Polyporus arcularius HHB13444]|uniref:F-box domain-containing protein n=1 Tax=Polyporus arcularius HHB13444 TaxID=1314778 RepID=A0A5C3NT82_9APHY|nr:hypothetical protein K466DRAFT_605101 [Polyporus arcularius HHB13444]
MGVPSDVKLEPVSSVSEFQLLDEYLLGVLLAVRGRMNQLSSIDRFPPEVLAAIFDFVRLPKWHEDTDRELPPDHRSLIAITHVCRRWRTVALDCSSLWTGIVACSSSAQPFAERSHGAPVDISVAVIRGQLPKTQKSLLVKLRPLIRSLRVSLNAPRELPIFRKALKELSGSLQALAITVRSAPCTRPIAHIPYSATNHTIAVSLFGGPVATGLKSLSISSMNPLIPTDLFPSLLHLHLSRFRWGEFLNPLWKLLRNAPNLETFHLHPVCERWSHIGRFPDNENSPIVLARIRRFCITSFPEGYHFHNGRALQPASEVLSRLGLPPGALVTIQERSDCSGSPLMSGLFSPSAAAASPRRSALTVSEGGTTAFTRGGDSTYVIRYRKRMTPYVVIPSSAEAQELRWNPFETHGSLLASVHLLRFQGSASWDLRPDLGIDDIALWRLVGRMPFLTTLILRDFKREMLRNLTHLLEHDGDVVICPVLSSVVLSTLDLPRCHRRDESPTGYTRAEMSTPVLDVLFRATARRAERGYPLKRLTYCSPHNEREYTLENVHGVEHVAVLRHDVWAEYSSATMDEGVAAHWAAVRRSMPANAESDSDGYPALWEGRLRGMDPPSTTRHFRTHGHKRRRV